MKQELSIPFNVSRIGDHSAAAVAGISLTTWRTTILEEIVESALHSNVTATNFSQWYNHSLTFASCFFYKIYSSFFLLKITLKKEIELKLN